MNQGALLVLVTSLVVIAVVYGFFGLLQWAANHEHQAKVQQE